MFSPEDFIIRRQCTPFCETQCKYAGEHHPILVALINCVDARGFNEFTKKIAKFMKRGWKKDDPIEDPDPEFRYPLVHWATVLGNVMALKWCVDHKLDLNKRWGPRSGTALHRFMVCGYSALRENSDNVLKTFKKLIKHLKVLLKSKDDNKDLPVHVAAKVLVERPLTTDSRFDTIYTEMVKVLVLKSCELDIELLNCRNLDGNTVMHIVAQHDKGCDILELLIENGARCDLTNGEGLKPIDIARSKDATDIIAVLCKDDEEADESIDVIDVEEIGDVDTIYIESDDDMDKNNNDYKDEAYIRNLLERVKSEPEDRNDVDWTLDSSVNMDASTSNDTLYTMDDDSYDIDYEVFSSVDDKRTLKRIWDDYPLEGSSSSRKDHDKRDTGQKSNLKRKSSNVADSAEHVSKKLHSDIVNGSKSSSRKSKETSTTNKLEKIDRQMEMTKHKCSDVNESTTVQSQQHGKESSSKAKRKLSSKSSMSGLDVKKQKSVSPQLKIVSLNKSAFNLLKKKIKQGSTTTGKIGLTAVKSNEISKTPRKLRKSSLRKSSEQILTEPLISDGERGVPMATTASVHERSSRENESETCHKQHETSSEVKTTCVRKDQVEPTQGELTDYLSLSQVKEPVALVTNFPTAKPANSPVRSSPDLATEILDEKSPEPRRPSSFEDEYVPQTPENSQRSFSSSAEISSAYLRLQEKLYGSTSVNLPTGTLLRDILYIFNPVKTPTEEPVGRSSPNPIPMPVETTIEKPVGRSTPNPIPMPVETTTEKPNGGRSTPSPVLMEHNRPKKRIEDVVTNLRERQHAGSQNSATLSRDSTSESLGTMSDNNLSPQDGVGRKSNAENISVGDQTSGERPEQQTLIQQGLELVKSVHATKDNLTSGQGSNGTLEQQVVVESAQPEQESGGSTQMETDDPTSGSNIIPKQHVAVTSASNQSSQPEQDLAKATETSQDRQPTFQISSSNIVIKKEVDDGEYSGSLVTEQTHQTSLSRNTETTSEKQNTVQVKKEKDDENNVYGDASQVICRAQAVPMVSETTSRGTVPAIAVKVEVGNNESTCSGVNATTTSSVKKTPNGEHIESSDLVQPQAGDKINQTTSCDQREHVSNIITKRSHKRPRIPGNALPTQVQAGSYRVMLPDSASTLTDTPYNSASDTTGNADGNTSEQSLSNTVDKFSEAVDKIHAPPSSATNTSGNSIDKTNPNYDPLTIMVDEICEDVYGISPGRQKQNVVEKQGEALRHNAPNNVVQGQVSTQQPDLLSVTLPSQTQNSVQSEPPVLSHVAQLQTKGLIQGQGAEHGRLRVINVPHPQSTVPQTQGQGAEHGRLPVVNVPHPQSTVPQTQGQGAEHGRLPVVNVPHPQSTVPQTQGQGAEYGRLPVVNVPHPQSTVPQTQGQGAEYGRLPVVNVPHPQSTVPQTQGQGQHSVQVTMEQLEVAAKRMQLAKMLAQRDILTPMVVRQSQVPRQAQPILQQPGQVVPGSANGLQRTAPQQHGYVPQVANQGNRMINPQITRVGMQPQNMTRPANMIRHQIPTGHIYNIARHDASLQYLPSTAPQNVNQIPIHQPPSVQARPTVPLFGSVDQLWRYLRNAGLRPTVSQANVSTLERNTSPSTSQVNVSALVRNTNPRLIVSQANVPTLVRNTIPRSTVSQANVSTLVQNARPSTSQVNVSTLYIVRNTSPRPSTNQVNVSRQQTQTFKLNDGRVVRPDMATAMANKTSKDPTRGNVSNQQVVEVRDQSSALSDVYITGSRGPTLQSHHTSPEPPGLPGTTPANHQPSASDTNNPEESEDEGLGLNGFTETDNVKDMFKDMAGTKKMLENLLNLVPKEDILQLLQKTKVDRKEQIDKWTKEYEDAARIERHKYVEYEKLKEKITRDQEKLRKAIKQAGLIRKEKMEAATKKTVYQNKIAEESEKIPVITEFINMFSTDSDGTPSGQ